MTDVAIGQRACARAKPVAPALAQPPRSFCSARGRPKLAPAHSSLTLAHTTIRSARRCCCKPIVRGRPIICRGAAPSPATATCPAGRCIVAGAGTALRAIPARRVSYSRCAPHFRYATHPAAAVKAAYARRRTSLNAIECTVRAVRAAGDVDSGRSGQRQGRQQWWRWRWQHGYVGAGYSGVTRPSMLAVFVSARKFQSPDEYANFVCLLIRSQAVLCEQLYFVLWVLAQV